MTLQTYILKADAFAIASLIPLIIKLGIILVYRLPGPRIIISASSIAASASEVGYASSSVKESLSIATPLLGILASPSILVPSLYSAIKCILLTVAGTTLPRIAKTLLVSLTALSKSPSVNCTIAVKNKIQKTPRTLTNSYSFEERTAPTPTITTPKSDVKNHLFTFIPG